MRSQRCFREAKKRVLDSAIRAAQRRAGRFGTRFRAAFDMLLRAVQERTSVLAPRLVSTGIGRRVIRALLAMTMHRWRWCAPIQTWLPPEHERRSESLVIASLAEHLFARFPMPRFMASVWKTDETSPD